MVMKENFENMISQLETVYYTVTAVGFTDFTATTSRSRASGTEGDAPT